MAKKSGRGQAQHKPVAAAVRASVGQPDPALAKLAIRAQALQFFDALSDDSTIGYFELSFVDGRSETALRQARYSGRLNLPTIDTGSRDVRFRVGTVRERYRREVPAVITRTRRHERDRAERGASASES